MLIGIALSGRAWLNDNPQMNPWAPLDLREPGGWATSMKILALKNDPELCRQTLERSAVAFDVLDPAGRGRASGRTDWC